MILLFDLDDVLANLRQSLYQSLSAATGIDTHWQHWPHYDLTRHYEISKVELNKVLVREQVLENCVPEPEAATTTQILRKLGFRQIIITARGWHPDAYAITGDWLTQHGIHYDELLIVPLGGNKIAALDAIELAYHDVSLAIDDHPKNIDRYIDSGITTLMVDMPWNQSYQTTGSRQVQRIYSLASVVDTAKQVAAS